MPPPADAPDALTLLQPLTAKSVLLVANVDEGSNEFPPAILEYARSQRPDPIAISARLEAEVALFDPENAAAIRADLGLTDSGLDRVVRGAFGLLHLIAFFTTDEDKPAPRHLRQDFLGLARGEPDPLRHPACPVRAEVVDREKLVHARGMPGPASDGRYASRKPATWSPTTSSRCGLCRGLGGQSRTRQLSKAVA